MISRSRKISLVWVECSGRIPRGRRRGKQRVVIPPRVSGSWPVRITVQRERWHVVMVIVEWRGRAVHVQGMRERGKRRQQRKWGRHRRRRARGVVGATAVRRWRRGEPAPTQRRRPRARHQLRAGGAGRGRWAQRRRQERWRWREHVRGRRRWRTTRAEH